jgi:ubiquinone/menaquinone biosynthesis C-methylase UbiE/DNA-binding transcriptional ArsR family regulator
MSTQKPSFAALAPLDSVLTALEAAGEITRLRLLALLAEAELTVSELVGILGQSQPRVSRHLKLLFEAGLVERHREGAWAFFLLAERTRMAQLVRDVVAHLDPGDPVLAADRARLAEARRLREQKAAAYFAEHAETWDAIRSLHVAEETVEKAIRDEVGGKPLQALLDLGAGTGRMLELLAPLADRAVGVDLSPAMLKVARARIERARLRNVQLRQGDVYAPPVEGDGYDLVVIHQVLHYLDDPGRAIREASRTLRAGGRLIIVDFAPHELEFLREQHAHRRLGFPRAEIEAYLREAGLDATKHRELSPAGRAPAELTVSIWVGKDPRLIYDAPPQRKEFA